eukprot:CAMPEP_0206477116 /NCGR_PEP_ID=MMETSP0324_2-20121206/35151_1 /ASSEMBLY_ACC=CAM_ASM_000836 /TAXON_ID=2866 /ORGANISM="Crypthecodinium cohnii, Strain Seligo" /LENGTH=302 /DNA_ID=CAMNT_0053952939 /DNA_START=47 /DNA_END=955 /DNA_ORIENTATION=-
MACTVIFTLMEITFSPCLDRETEWCDVFAQLGMMIFLAQSTSYLYSKDVDMEAHIEPVKYLTFILVVGCVCLVVGRITLSFQPDKLSTKRLKARQKKLLAEARIWMSEAMVADLREYMVAMSEMSYYDWEGLRRWTSAAKSSFLRSAPPSRGSLLRDFVGSVHSGQRLSYVPPEETQPWSNFERSRATIKIHERWSVGGNSLDARSHSTLLEAEDRVREDSEDSDAEGQKWEVMTVPLDFSWVVRRQQMKKKQQGNPIDYDVDPSADTYVDLEIRTCISELYGSKTLGHVAASLDDCRRIIV